MAGGYIDEAYVRLILGDGRVTSLAGDSVVVDKLIDTAEGDTHAALTLGGYGSYSPTVALAQHSGDVSQVPQIVRNGALGAFIDALYGRKNQQPPINYSRFVQTNRHIATGDLPVPGLTRATKEGPSAIARTTASDNSPVREMTADGLGQF